MTTEHFILCAYIVRGQLVVLAPSFHREGFPAPGLGLQHLGANIREFGDQTRSSCLNGKYQLSRLSNSTLSFFKAHTNNNYLKNQAHMHPQPYMQRQGIKPKSEGHGYTV